MKFKGNFDWPLVFILAGSMTTLFFLGFIVGLSA